MKTRSEKAADPNLICILPTPEYSLETGPFPTSTNAAERFPILPPNNREGGRSVVLYLTHFSQKEAQGGGIFISTLHVSPERRRRGECYFEFRPISPNNIGAERRRSIQSDPTYRKMKREEGTGVKPCPLFTYFFACKGGKIAVSCLALMVP